MQCRRCGYEVKSTWQSCPQCGFGSSHTELFVDPAGSNIEAYGMPMQRAGRKVSTLAQNELFQGEILQPMSAAQNPLSLSSLPEFSVPEGDQELASGALLYGKSYALVERLEQQNWRDGVYEAVWSAVAVQQGNMPVTICEVMLPENSAGTQLTLRPAIRSLLSMADIPHLPILREFFRERQRNFFVFPSAHNGESLSARMQRLGPLPEREVLEYCLQVIMTLEQFAQRSLVHGQIRPEHCMVMPDGSCVLINCSPLVIGGAYHYIRDTRSAYFSPFMSEEFRRGEIDGKADLYALMATAYHLLTGRPPLPIGGIFPRVRQLNAECSQKADVLFAKALHPLLQQRYQHPTELRRAIQEILPAEHEEYFVPSQGRKPRQPRTISLVSTPGEMPEPLWRSTTRPSMPLVPPLPQSEPPDKPDEPPVLRPANDLRTAIYWLACFLVVLSAITIVAR